MGNKFFKMASAMLMLGFILCSFPEVNAISIGGKITNESIPYITMNFETQEETAQAFRISNNGISTFSSININHTESYNPNQNGVQPASIIGGDERVRVSDPSAFPNSTVAYLEAYFPDGTTGIGTAFVWYKNLALTAGHCIYDSEHGGWAKAITIWPGKNGFSVLNNPYGTADVSRAHVSHDYYYNNSSSEDWALLELNSNIGEKCGWRGISYSENYSGYTNQNVTLAGYPYPHRYYQYQATGPVKIANSMNLYYDIDTENGQSGSPIWSSNGYCIGIHVHATSSSMPWNSCSNITKDRFQFFTSKMD